MILTEHHVGKSSPGLGGRVSRWYGCYPPLQRWEILKWWSPLGISLVQTSNLALVYLSTSLENTGHRARGKTGKIKSEDIK